MATPEPVHSQPWPTQPPSSQPRPGEARPGQQRAARVVGETAAEAAGDGDVAGDADVAGGAEAAGETAAAEFGADLAALRRGYGRGGGRLDEHGLAPTWVEQFAHWFDDAAAAGSGIVEPNAMVFGTADAAGRPSARTVLLKGYGAEGFLLFTNYTSRKGQESAVNPYGSLVFPWYALERQVIVVGAVERVSARRSAEYFHSRPHGSQLGAWASHQSAVLSSREELERRDAELAERWPPGTPIPVPPFWGGLLVVPETVEFWQGRPDRLHDRLRYRCVTTDASTAPAWIVERLSP